MTTNIFDSTDLVMATDSRWSVQYGKWVLYLDDAGYEKIIIRNDKALMFAGFGRVIQQWKDWIYSDPKDASGMPAHKGMSVCMVDVFSKAVEFAAHQDIVADGVYCAGSGARPAYGCWFTNRSAYRAVETAKLMDLFSGGEVKFVDFKNNSNNLKYPLANVTITMVDEAIRDRGLAMKINVPSVGNPPFPFSPLAAGQSADEEVPIDLIRTKIATGELSANAPCDGMYNEWSKQDKDQFATALGKMFGWK